MPREGRLAIARNLALDELSTMPLTDYVIMIDMDIIGWDINGILDSFSLHVPVPVMSHENGMNNSGFSADVNIDRDNDSGRNSNRIDRVSDRLSDISSDISDSGIKENYKHKSKWDVICSNGIILHGVYRDIYAFRVDGLNTNHHWAGQDGADYGLVDTDLAKRRQNLNVSFFHISNEFDHYL